MTSPGLVEGRQLLHGHVLVQVVDDRVTEAAELAVDLAHQLLDPATLVRVVLDALPGGHRHLHQRAAAAVELTAGQQVAEGLEPHVDALRVVQPVDPQQDDVRVAQARTEPDRVRLGARAPAISSNSATSIEIGKSPTSTRRPSTIRPRTAPWTSSRRREHPDQVLDRTTALQPDHVGTQDPAEDLLPPRAAS